MYDLTRVLYTYANYALKWIKTPLQETAHTSPAITSYKSLSCLDRRRMAWISRLYSPNAIQKVAEGLKSPVLRAVRSSGLNASKFPICKHIQCKFSIIPEEGRFG